MNIGYVGSSPFAPAAMQGLLGEHRVSFFGPDADQTCAKAGAREAASLTELARCCELIIIGPGSDADLREVASKLDGEANALSPGKIILDLRPGAPDEARAMGETLQQRGVVLLDAPIHAESPDAGAESTVMMCGGQRDAFESVRPVLATLCPNVVYCGDAGSGRAAGLVVAAVAACNRLVTYECATVGVKNGLALEDMATVLSKSSGSNSATRNVLPVLGRHGHTSDVSLDAAVTELKLALRLAMQCGAPLLFTNFACSVYEAAASQFGASATIDAIARIFESGAGMSFADVSRGAASR